MTDPDAATTAAYASTIAAGMRGLNDHFHAVHDDEDSVEECCVAAVIEAAGYADAFDACQQATARERQRIRKRLLAHEAVCAWSADDLLDDTCVECFKPFEPGQRRTETDAGAGPLHGACNPELLRREPADLLDGERR